MGGYQPSGTSCQIGGSKTKIKHLGEVGRVTFCAKKTQQPSTSKQTSDLKSYNQIVFFYEDVENTTRKQIVGASDVEREGQKEIKFLNWRRRSYSCHFGLSVFCVFPSIVGFDLSCARGKFTRQPFDLGRSWKGCDVVDCTRKGRGGVLGQKVLVGNGTWLVTACHRPCWLASQVASRTICHRFLDIHATTPSFCSFALCPTFSHQPAICILLDMALMAILIVREI